MNEGKEREKLQIGSVVQIKDTPDLCMYKGCLMQVKKVENWGIIGILPLPNGIFSYVRIKWGEMNYVGDAELGYDLK